MPSLWYFVNKVRSFRNDFFFFFNVFFGSCLCSQCKTEGDLTANIVIDFIKNTGSLAKPGNYVTDSGSLIVSPLFVASLKKRDDLDFSQICSMKPSNFFINVRKEMILSCRNIEREVCFACASWLVAASVAANVYTFWSRTSMTFDTLSRTIASFVLSVGSGITLDNCSR